MKLIAHGTQSDLAHSVIDVTGSKLRSFLYELAEGVTNYRTVHSLTEQVQHQYHGRFAIELIQNGYDAIARDPHVDEGAGRIELRFVKNRAFGTLYVANDGLPFSDSNFLSVSQLGQSDKSPETSIGNKGIGFRSVLEICDQPQIWSKRSQSSERFDGYCFGFSPEFVRSLHKPIMALVTEHGPPQKGGWLRDIVDWDNGLLAKLRSSIHLQADAASVSAEQWVRSQLTYLSPYLLPYPLRSVDRESAIDDLEADGFATVVALPLKSLASARLVERRLSEIDARSLLFLDRLKALTLSIPGNTRNLSRKPERPAEGSRHYSEIRIKSSENTQRFRTWRREISVADMPDDVRASILGLPGQWPKLKKVEITLAVGSSETPTPGQLSIFLPTMLGSGASVNVNAPFFGDMSRTEINFGQLSEDAEGDAVYNKYLLAQAADLAIEAIEADLRGKSAVEAADIVDLLAPNSADGPSADRWQMHLRHAAEARDLRIHETPWFLSDMGWVALCEASLLPLPAKPKVLTAAVLRQNAKFPAYTADLDGRSSAIKALSDAHEIDWLPLPDDQAATVESAAVSLHASGPVDWAGFWEDMRSIFEDDLSPLVERKILLCTDGHLHAGGVRGSAVYFKPRQTGPDEDDGPGDVDVDQIPEALRNLIAVLDPGVPVSEMRDGRLHNTELHGALSNAGLVAPFRRESVLSQVLIPNLPTLPVRQAGPQADLCRDTLSYGVRLLQSMQVRGEGKGALGALARLPVPCRGGWYRLDTASFGDGWAETNGGVVERYLRLCRTKSARAARDRILRPPEHPDWAGLGHTILELLRDAGVHDGLRLSTIKPGDWEARFQASKHYFLLPAIAPPDVNQSAWTKVCEVALQDAQPRYNSGEYQVGDLSWIPGLEGYAEFDTNTRAAFFEAVIASAGAWQDDWDRLGITRVAGSWDQFILKSPLRLKLESLEWIGEPGNAGDWSWSAASQRWYVQSQYLARGRAWTFDHLSPLPPEIAEQLDRDEGLVSFLNTLGMPTYAPEELSDDQRLLNSLAATTEQNAYQNRDVFIGQIRTAWRAFQPTSADDFPDKIIVHSPDGSLASVTPSVDKPVYLPNARTTSATLRSFGLPSVVIEPTDATRLSSEFGAAYDSGVRSAAQIQMAPLSAGARWTVEGGVPLTDFSGLEEAIPFVLTIATFHGVNARGTSATSFNRYLDLLRRAKVSIVADLGLVPVVDDQQVAPPRLQKAVWMESEYLLLLDRDWEADIEPVADAFTQLIEREDLKFQIRKGLSEVWPDLDETIIARLLGQMDLSLEHYREVFELWRGDLGPAVERLSHLMWVLSCPEQSAQLQQADQPDLIRATLRAVFDSDTQAESIFQAALEARDVFEFGRVAQGLLGGRVELAAWNRELARAGKPELVNPAAADEFARHREAAAPYLRRIVASAAAAFPDGPAYPEMMKHIESIACPVAVARAFWQVPFSEFARVTAADLGEMGCAEDFCALLETVANQEEFPQALEDADAVVGADPLDLSKINRKRAIEVFDRFLLIATAWHGGAGASHSADWLSGCDGQALDAALAQDRTIYTKAWTDWSIFGRLAASLPNAAPADLRQELADAQSLDTLGHALGVSPEQLDGAAEALEKARQDAERRKRLVKVCGADFDNTEDNLSALFDHISEQIDEGALAALQGFDLQAPLIPSKRAKPKRRSRRDDGKPTRAPKRQGKKMEDLIGAAGEIHAFRWLQRRYGAASVSPSNWVSAYSEKAYPDNESSVDEGRGCDIYFAHDGCTYFIEVKSTDGDTTDFILGPSEVRLAREIGRSRRKRAKQLFYILRVSNALSTSPIFTLLPNPYDPKYEGHFDILDEGARISYRP